MDLLLGLVMGFERVLTPIYLLFVLIGVFFGLVVGALPGLGPTAAIAILLPLTYKSDPVLSMIMLTGIYYGAMFGGAYTSIMLNIPGESSAVMTTLEGYQLALQGRASQAIQMANIASFVGGTLSVIGLTIAAPLLSQVALAFGPPEYFVLMMLGLSAIAFVGTGSPVKALIAGCFGLILGTIGSEPITGAQRYTFGSYNLGDGIPFAAVAMGIFAIAEVLSNIEEGLSPFSGKIEKELRIKWPDKEEFKVSISPTLQGTGIGFILGALPGVGPTIASFISYSMAKLQSKRPEKWGKGAIEGIAAVESANNAAAEGAMVPLLSLGIPGSSATAILLGGLLMHGLRPGPLLFSEHPEIPWGVIASMYVGNIVAVIIGICLSVYFAYLLKLPPAVLNATIFIVTIIGAYSINNNLFDVWVLFVFGIIGYFFKKAEIPEAPLVLGLVLGPLVETTLGQSLIMSHGSVAIFVQRPVSLVLLIILVIIYLSPLIKLGLKRFKNT